MSHRIGILALVLAMVTCAWAEDPYVVAWTAQIGTDNTDESYSVAVDASGNAYISGQTRGDLGGPNAGWYDAFLSKFDSGGNELWTTQIGTGSYDASRSVAVDASGNAYISGYTDGDLGGPNAGYYDAFLSKFDSGGNEVWTSQIGTSGDDYSLSVAVATSGNVYISGITDGDLGGPNAGASDAFLSKFDSGGNEVWTSQIGSIGDGVSAIVADDGSWSVAVGPSGNAYITGHTPGALGGATPGAYDAFLSKFDSGGNELWTTQIGTVESDESYSVAVDASGNAYISGETAGDLGGPNAGGRDAFLSKFDSAGNELWTTQIGTSSHDYSRSITVAGSGDLYITGYTSGNLGGVNAGDRDAFLSKFDSSGNELWTTQIGTSDREHSWSVALDASGNAYITGWTKGDLGGPNAGGSDAFLVKYEVPEPATVVLDIKPNSVNLKSKGLLPVVVYGSDQLDVTEIDLDLLLLNGVGPRLKPNGSWHVSFKDVDGDLLLDLLMHFEMQALAQIIDPGTTELSLTGALMDGTEFEGADAIRIVPDFNGDLMVNATDLAIMKAGFGLSGMGWANGNANCDSIVDATDLAILKANFAFVAPTGAVPEPATLGLLALGALALLKGRQRYAFARRRDR